MRSFAWLIFILGWMTLIGGMIIAANDDDIGWAALVWGIGLFASGMLWAAVIGGIGCTVDRLEVVIQLLGKRGAPAQQDAG